MVPFCTSEPIQSWAPTITSGPSPVGFWVMKSSFIVELSLTTSSTVIPVSSLKSSATACSGSWRFWSTHMVMVLAPASERSWLGDAVAVPCSVAPAGEEDAGAEEPPPHAVSARAENAAVRVRLSGRRKRPPVVVDCMMCLSRGVARGMRRPLRRRRGPRGETAPAPGG